MSRPLGCLALLAVLLPPPAALPAGPPADALGDPLPDGALVRAGSLRLRHAGHALAVAFAPDGKALASGGADHVVRLWDAATGKELRTFTGHTGDVNALAFSSDGKRLASAGEDGSARVWDVDTGKERLAFRGHGERAVRGLAFAPDDRSLATKGEDGTVLLWDAATGKESGRIAAAAGQGTSDVAFAPDGKVIAGIGSEAVVLWDLKGKELRRFTEPSPGDVTSLAFSPDGKLLLSGGLDRAVRLWDVEKGKHLRDFGGRAGLPGAAGHTDLVAAVRFGPGGKTAASGGADGMIRLWDAATGKELRVLKGHADTVASLAFTTDGKVLASASHDGTVKLWDAATGKELPQSQRPDAVTSAALSADGKLLATGHADGTIRFRDAATGKELAKVIREKLPMSDLCWSPDGKALAGRRTGPDDVTLWDVATGKEVGHIDEKAMTAPGARVSRGPAGTLAFAPDGKVLATVDRKQAVRLWDAATGKELPTSPLKRAEEGEAVRVAFAPDGTLAVGYADCDVRFWNVGSGREVRKFTTPNGLPTGLAFAPGGHLAATAGGDGGPHLWEVASGQECRADAPADEAPATAVAVSADGRLLLAAGPDGGVRVADLYTLKPVKVLRGHRGAVTALAVAADGKLLSVGRDGTALVWDPAALKPPRGAAPKPTAAQLAALWDDLAANDGSAGYQALGRAVAAGAPAAEYLGERLQKAAAPDAKRIAKLVADLDADDFEARETASRELGTIGAPAVPALKKALEGSPAAEVQRRASELLKKLDGPASAGQGLRPERALGALEAIGSPEAVKALEALAKRGAGDELGRAAKAALGRLKKRTAP